MSEVKQKWCSILHLSCDSYLVCEEEDICLFPHLLQGRILMKKTVADAHTCGCHWGSPFSVEKIKLRTADSTGSPEQTKSMFYCSVSYCLTLRYMEFVGSVVFRLKSSNRYRVTLPKMSLRWLSCYDYF